MDFFSDFPAYANPTLNTLAATQPAEIKEFEEFDFSVMAAAGAEEYSTSSDSDLSDLDDDAVQTEVLLRPLSVSTRVVVRARTLLTYALIYNMLVPFSTRLMRRS